ncbi:MAG: PrsW family glutamic-type intramembrane protease [Alphaproteobacteria bacterium]
MFPVLLMILAAITPTVLLVTYFASDHRFPQPRRVIWATFILGVAAVVFATAIEAGIHNLLTAAVREPMRFALYKSFLAFALPEEAMKFVILRYYCMRVASFSVPKDGLVYGATVSLGFSAFESVFYLVQGGFTWGLVFMRALMAVPMHVAVGAVMGLILVFLRWRPAQRPAIFALAIGVPVVFHGLYNFVLLLPPYVPVPGLFEAVRGPQSAIGIVILAAATAVLLFRRLASRVGVPAGRAR